MFIYHGASTKQIPYLLTKGGGSSPFLSSSVFFAPFITIIRLLLGILQKCVQSGGRDAQQTSWAGLSPRRWDMEYPQKVGASAWHMSSGRRGSPFKQKMSPFLMSWSISALESGETLTLRHRWTTVITYSASVRRYSVRISCHLKYVVCIFPQRLWKNIIGISTAFAEYLCLSLLSVNLEPTAWFSCANKCHKNHNSGLCTLQAEATLNIRSIHPSKRH